MLHGGIVSGTQPTKRVGGMFRVRGFLFAEQSYDQLDCALAVPFDDRHERKGCFAMQIGIFACENSEQRVRRAHVRDPPKRSYRV